MAAVNKIDRAGADQLAHTLALIRGQRPDIPILQTSFGVVREEILNALAQATSLPEANMPLTADLTLKIGRLIVLSGSGMPVRKRVQEAAAWYSGQILSIT